jgi:hypothetical protein
LNDKLPSIEKTRHGFRTFAVMGLIHSAMAFGQFNVLLNVSTLEYKLQVAGYELQVAIVTIHDSRVFRYQL